MPHKPNTSSANFQQDREVFSPTIIRIKGRAPLTQQEAARRREQQEAGRELERSIGFRWKPDDVQLDRILRFLGIHEKYNRG